MSEGRTLIAIAGADGAGKTTVSKLLVERLNASGRSARYVDRWDIVGSARYPAADFLLDDVPHIRGRVPEMPPQPRLLFLLWTMALAASETAVRDATTEVVVLDGYWMKHAASEVVYGLDDQWVASVVNGLPAPDLVLRLRLDPVEAWRRKGGDVLPYECGMDDSCSRQAFLEHQGRIEGRLADWAAVYEWQEVDASAPLADIVENAVSHALAAAEPRLTDE
jgi:thymidylate kinase